MDQRRDQLHPRPGFPPRSNDRRPQQRSFAPRSAKGHDALLKDLQDTGALVKIVLLSGGNALTGRIVGRDKFTISLLEGNLYQGEFKVSDGDCPAVIYKHGVEFFKQVSKAPSAQVV